MTLGTDTERLPQAVIVACAADVKHEHDSIVGLVAPNGSELIQGKDYLSVLNPGTYPPSLDTFSDLCVRFALPPIVVITHSDCGVIVSIRELAEHPELDISQTPIVFGDSAKEILDHFETHGISRADVCTMSDAEIAEALARLIALRISDQFTSCAQEVSDSDDVTDMTKRLANLPGSRITAAYTAAPGAEPVQVIPWTHVNDVADLAAPGGILR